MAAIAWLIHQPQAHLSQVPSSWFLPLYLVVSILFGITMSSLVEIPMLRIRDTWFHSKSM